MAGRLAAGHSERHRNHMGCGSGELNYRAECFDTAAGMANAMHFVRSDGKDIVVGTNRKIDELAYYVFTE